MWIFPGHFFSMTLIRSHGPNTMHIEYYGTSRRCLAAILTDLQAFNGNKCLKRGISLKINFGHLNLLWGSKIQKNGYRALELDVPSCRKCKIGKNQIWRPPVSTFSCKNPLWAPAAINVGWNLWIWDFWPKSISFHLVMHILAQKSIWFG